MPAKNQLLASNLNSASPPYYPSGSSSNDINLAQKREAQTGGRNIGPVMDEGFPVQQKNALIQGKNAVDSVSMAKLYINESIPQSVGKPSNNARMARHGSSGVDPSQSPHLRASATGTGVSIPVQTNFQRASSQNKVSPSQFQAIQTDSVPGRNSTSVQATAPQLGQRPGSESPLSPTPINSHDSGELDSASESGKGKGALVGKGRGGSHGAGRGTFVYGGAQVIGTAGNVGVSHGDPNFPAFLPGLYRCC